MDTWDSKSQKIKLSFDSTIEFRLEVLKHCSEHMGVQFHDRCQTFHLGMFYIGLLVTRLKLECDNLRGT